MKYQKVTGWWVYVIKSLDNMYYPGCSGQKYVCGRWNPNGYRRTELYPYIEQYGWDNLEKIVLIDGLTKEQALQWENRLIKMYQQLNCCINKKTSGGDSRTIQRLRSDSQKRMSKLRELPEYKIYYKVDNYNHCHPDQIKETPLEAKRKYLESGYIPDYIIL